MDQDLLIYMTEMTGEKTINCNYDKVFMYVKNYCHYSQHAAALAIEQCPIVYVLDMITYKLVTPGDLKQTIICNNSLIPHLIQKFNQKQFPTVPQIFVHNNGWHYVGGCDDFEAFTKSNNTMEHILTGFQSVKL